MTWKGGMMYHDGTMIPTSTVDVTPFTCKTMHYTGVGSRRVDDASAGKLELATAIASRLEIAGYVLRSGGATGFDRAFEAGVKDPRMKEIYLPFTSTGSSTGGKREEAIEMVLALHPNPGAAKAYASILGRNVFQVLGADLATPSTFVACWTPDGMDSGGTGTTMRVARKFGIPVYNLFDPVATRELVTLVKRAVLEATCNDGKRNW